MATINFTLDRGSLMISALSYLVAPASGAYPTAFVDDPAVLQ